MILILDYGSQYTQLIARRVREANVLSRVVPYHADLSPAVLQQDYPNLQGVILSGGPASVYAEEGYPLNKSITGLDIPVLGICYGAQLLMQDAGGLVESAQEREFGRAQLEIMSRDDLFADINSDSIQVWMSHGDVITKPGQGYEVIGKSDHSPYAALRNSEERRYALQFHPEVYHTESGERMLKNFVYNVCQCAPDWTPDAFVTQAMAKIKEQVGDGQVVAGVSGGVDSTVMAVLLHRALGKQAHFIFVDTGLLRKNERQSVEQALKEKEGLDLITVDASEDFFTALKGVTEPEEKRKKAGHAFVQVFDRVASEIGQVDFLGQGTLYPDVIESTANVGPSVTIKSHHNVGGLPEDMKMGLVEPLRDLFKDEVRKVGETLGIDRQLLYRHPFPGPGLAIRILGEVTPERADILREADAIFVETLHRHNHYDKVWQALVVLLPVKSVGVMGDERTYENVAALRSVDSVDGMTADWSPLPHDLLAEASNRIINEVRGINRVVYDISSKPPSTIEWE